MLRILLVLSIFFAACSKKEPTAPKQSLHLSIESEPTSLDPRKARDLASGVVLRMLFEGLTRISQENKPEPALAEKIDISDDGLKYTFFLKKTKWSDGSPVTASDFIFAWGSCLDPQFRSDVAYHMYPIKNAKKVKMGELPLSSLGISAPDSQTLVVELEEPTPYFLELLTMPVFSPVSEKNVANWAQEAATYVCNGPFTIAHWSHADSLELKKNDLYWEKEAVSLDGVKILVVAADTALRMFEEKKLDWTGSPLSTLPNDAIATFKKEKKLNVSPFLATGFCRLNISKTIGDQENPLSNPHLRKALALSLDRHAIVEHILCGGQSAATSLVPPEMGLSCGYFSDHDLGAAKELFQEKPVKPLVISYYNNERNTLIAQTLQKQWQENLGIPVEIEAVEGKVYFQRISRKEYQIAIGSWTADFNDPINFLEVFQYKDNGTNNTTWENPEYIDLLSRSRLCKNLEERKELLKSAEKILMDDMPIIPIYHFALNYMKNDALTGVYVSPQGHIDLRGATIR